MKIFKIKDGYRIGKSHLIGLSYLCYPVSQPDLLYVIEHFKTISEAFDNINPKSDLLSIIQSKQSKPKLKYFLFKNEPIIEIIDSLTVRELYPEEFI